MKTCKHCLKTKPLSEFNLNHKQHDQRMVWCKTCQGIYATFYQHFGRQIRWPKSVITEWNQLKNL